ncbi:MAG: rane protein [Armatimonadetes bacterium]|jgi:hypothetical protein|nr:rane protein [Armatimonadota bacterium]
MRIVFVAGYWAIVILFVVCAMALICFAGMELWRGVVPATELPLKGRFDAILESIGLLTIAVASLELGQTVLEEEVLRSAHLSAPTRVRRFLSRFMIVVIVSLAIECLVATFQVAHQNPSHLIYAASIGVAAAGLLAAWGLFVKLNTAAEELEPVAMAQVKEEDEKMDQDAAA